MEQQYGVDMSIDDVADQHVDANESEQTWGPHLRLGCHRQPSRSIVYEDAEHEGFDPEEIHIIDTGHNALQIDVPEVAQQGSQVDALRPYQPLANPTDIRLLILAPGSFEDKLMGRLRTCSLGYPYPAYCKIDQDGIISTPKVQWAYCLRSRKIIWYTALSYVWGPPIFNRIIECNGYEMRITSNLADALRHFRLEDTAIILWIDQLCINQADLDEKGLQVQMMSRVYTRAWSVVVWLGNPIEKSGQIMAWIKSFPLVYDRGPVADETSHGSLANVDLPVFGTEDWILLDRFLAQAWFQRVWIIQEVRSAGVSSIHLPLLHAMNAKSLM